MVTPTDQQLKKRFPVMEIFGPTIQGEGLVAGTQTHFIRFGYCDYKCTKCDSLHAVLPESVKKHATLMTVTEIMDRLVGDNFEADVPWVTLSGGNPAMHDLEYLVMTLQEHGFKVAVETQATLSPLWLHQVDVLTLSPKPPGMGVEFEHDKYFTCLDKFKNHPGLNIKIPIFDRKDLDFAVNIWDESGSWIGHRDIFYLSLGNPWPPSSGLNPDHIDEPVYAKKNAVLTDDEHIALALIDRYKEVYKMINEHPNHTTLAMYRFLPQLHVLLWGNARGK